MYIRLDMEAKLLSLGGESIIFGNDTESEVNRLLTKGTIHSTEGLTRYKKGMYPNRCHGNSAFLSTVKKSYKVVTGYALSEDNIWYHHSWLTNGRNIIETTFIFEMYYGYVLDGFELDNFILDNY